MSDQAKTQQAQALAKGRTHRLEVWRASEPLGQTQADQNSDSLNPGNIFASQLLRYTSHGNTDTLRFPGGTSLHLRACLVPAQ